MRVVVYRDYEVIEVKGRLTEPKRSVVKRDDGTTQSVLNLSVVTNRMVTKSDGTVIDEPRYYEVAIWGDAADKFWNMFEKGQTVIVKGQPNYSIYTKYSTQSEAVRVRIDPPPGGQITISTFDQKEKVTFTLEN